MSEPAEPDAIFAMPRLAAIYDAGFAVVEGRDAPDRPNREWMFVAEKMASRR